MMASVGPGVALMPVPRIMKLLKLEQHFSVTPGPGQPGSQCSDSDGLPSSEERRDCYFRAA